MRSDEAGLEDPVQVLDVAHATGVWVVRSTSNTVYYLDLDRGRLMRARGAGSPSFPFDDQWVPLVEVTSRDDLLRPLRTGEVRVGERPEYLTDPGGGVVDYEWRIQRAVTAIERVTDDEAAALRERAPDGPDSPDGDLDASR